MPNLNHIIYALSDALDLVGVDDLHHGKRVAYMALECANVLQWRKRDLMDIFHASLLHDCGVSSSRVHSNLVFTLDWDGAKDHCIRGYQLLNLSEKLNHLSKIILYHHTHWKNLQELQIDKETAMFANLIFLVDRVDALVAQHRSKNPIQSILTAAALIREEISELSGTFFDPKLVDAFLHVSLKEAFWFNFEEENLHRYLNSYMNTLDNSNVDLNALAQIAELFALLVDAKSPYTADHSLAVAQLSLFIAQKMGLQPEVCSKIEIAGLLHDLGKLRVPDELLDKESSLTSDEFNDIKIHAYETYQILSKIKGLEDISEWASQHHEKLNGKGYPNHTSSTDISLPARIIAVADIFQALAQQRPYRKSLHPTEIMKIIREKVEANEIDPGVVQTVESDIQECWEISIRHA